MTTWTLALALSASVLARRPSFPHSGDPCDSCIMLKRSCESGCAQKRRHPHQKKLSERQIERAARHGKFNMAQFLPDDPKKCRAECAAEVKSCHADCGRMRHAYELYNKKKRGKSSGR